MTKERGILMSGPSVLAYLAGKKRRTMRLIRNPLGATEDISPYGRVGDLLYFRETYALPREYDKLSPGHLARNHPELPVIYRASDEAPSTERGKWRPGLFMPRAFARITGVEITGLSIIGVSECTEQDALDEGVGSLVELQALWNELHPGRRWKSDPVVYAVRFKRYGGNNG